MRWLLLLVSIGAFLLSVSIRPAGTPLTAAVTIEPWATEEIAQRQLDLARAMRNDAAALVAADAANNATFRSILNLVGLGCGVAWMLLRRRKVRLRQQSPDPPAIESEPLLSPEETHAAQASTALEKRQREARDVYNTESAESHEAQDKLRRAIELVEKSGVGRSAVMISHYSWSIPEEVKLPKEGLAWRWQDFEFSLTELRDANYGLNSDDEYGKLVVTANGKEVLNLDVVRNLEREWSRWRSTGVSGLVPGPWMTSFVDFAGMLEVQDMKQKRDDREKYYIRKADGIQLPPDDEE